LQSSPVGEAINILPDIVERDKDTVDAAFHASGFSVYYSIYLLY
jgi:hypothetical protein